MSLIISEILPLPSGECIRFIELIQDQLCPSCPQNQDFNPKTKCDCAYRPKYVSAHEIYYGLCDEAAAEHWLGAIVDAKGALKLIKTYVNDDEKAPYYSQLFRRLFTTSCREAQMYMMQGYTWETIHEINRDPILRIGIAYKFMDPEDPVYNEMAMLGSE